MTSLTRSQYPKTPSSQGQAMPTGRVGPAPRSPWPPRDAQYGVAEAQVVSGASVTRLSAGCGWGLSRAITVDHYPNSQYLGSANSSL